MILVDTPVCVDHLRRGDPALAGLLGNDQVLGHPSVIGELGLGTLATRDEVLGLLANLPQAVPATHAEVMTFVDRHRLFGRGIGYVDVQLLAAAALTSGAALWTRDKRLHATAAGLGLAHPVAAPP
jgi:predicted nucleic acid-binding protein